jgi:GNAT superfamily N-acetyltransferase
VFEERPLDTRRHDRAGFACGVPALDDYLQRLAVQHIRKGIATVHVLVDDAAPETILGYYTLSAAALDSAALTEQEHQRLPRYPIPCFRLGRLACRADRRGEGLGRLLVACAVERCLAARKQVAAYALLVDAKDDKAAAFYRHYGFAPCAGQPLTLYLPLGT